MDEAPTYLSGTDPESDRRRRRIALVALLVALCLIAAGVAVATASYQRCKEPPAADGRSVDLKVPEGASGEDVVARLAQVGLIRCGGFVGNLLLRGTGEANTIRAGTYHLQVGSSLEEILGALTTAPDAEPTLRLTVPEGLRIRSTYPDERSISSIVEQQTGVKASAFAALTESGKLSLEPYLSPGRSAEGFLFPNTYEFLKKDLDAKVIASEMLHEFGREARHVHLADRAKALGLTPYQVVTVASMIEREAQVDRERPLIAGVIYNRLNTDQTLGIDATLLYDDPTPDGRLSSSDLLSTSAYNTRLHGGLPPTPIASPGRASLEAALRPESTDYLYYVLCPPDGNGVHRFAVTYAEHLANVQECLGG
jgi:UPF0755 protein